MNSCKLARLVRKRQVSVAHQQPVHRTMRPRLELRQVQFPCKNQIGSKLTFNNALVTMKSSDGRSLMMS